MNMIKIDDKTWLNMGLIQAVKIHTDEVGHKTIRVYMVGDSEEYWEFELSNILVMKFNDLLGISI